MANLIPASSFDDVYQLEFTDFVKGGAGNTANIQAQNLANRTKWLNDNKQDAAANLTALATLVSAADKLPYFTGSGAASVTTLTAFARTLNASADASTALATLTGGSMAATATTLGFYGVTPITKRAGAAQAAVATTAATNATPYGYSTAAQADAIVTLVNELRAWAVAQGFIKGSA